MAVVRVGNERHEYARPSTIAAGWEAICICRMVPLILCCRPSGDDPGS